MRQLYAFFFAFIIFSPAGFCADATDSSALAKVKIIEKRIDEIEKAQKDTLDAQEKIIADIKNLKIIVNKR